MGREQFTFEITGENLAQAAKRLHEKYLGLVAETRAVIDRHGLNRPLKATLDELRAQLKYHEEQVTICAVLYDMCVRYPNQAHKLGISDVLYFDLSPTARAALALAPAPAPAPTPTPAPAPSGAELIKQQRERQFALGHTLRHDLLYTENQLLLGAAAYIYQDEDRWPWKQGFAPKNRIRDLAKAGAMIAAEIDRLRYYHFQMTQERRNNNQDWPEWLHAAWNKENNVNGAVYCIGEPLFVRNGGVSYLVQWDSWLLYHDDEIYLLDDAAYREQYAIPS